MKVAAKGSSLLFEIKIDIVQPARAGRPFETMRGSNKPIVSPSSGIVIYPSFCPLSRPHGTPVKRSFMGFNPKVTYLAAFLDRHAPRARRGLAVTMEKIRRDGKGASTPGTLNAASTA
jgi:hypothetical protein